MNRKNISTYVLSYVTESTRLKTMTKGGYGVMSLKQREGKFVKSKLSQALMIMQVSSLSLQEVETHVQSLANPVPRFYTASHIVHCGHAQ